MNGQVPLRSIEVTVPANKVAKIRSIADRMRFEAGQMTYDEFQAMDRLRCYTCGEISVKGTQTDIGYICENCNHVSE